MRYWQIYIHARVTEINKYFLISFLKLILLDGVIEKIQIKQVFNVFN